MPLLVLCQRPPDSSHWHYALLTPKRSCPEQLAYAVWRCASCILLSFSCGYDHTHTAQRLQFLKSKNPPRPKPRRACSAGSAVVKEGGGLVEGKIRFVEEKIEALLCVRDRIQYGKERPGKKLRIIVLDAFNLKASE